jgi:hypothetical protein
MPDKICALDMGSNTIKFAIGEFKMGEFILHEELRETIGAGDDIQESYLKKGIYELSENKLKQIHDAFINYKKICYHKTRSFLVYAVATAAYREATNALEIEKMAAEIDLKLEIASPEREAKLTYETATLGKRNMAVVGIGARSVLLATMTSGFGWRAFKAGYRNAFEEHFKNASTFSEGAESYKKKLASLISDSDLKILKDKETLYIVDLSEATSFIFKKDPKYLEGKIISKELIDQFIKNNLNLSPEKYRNLISSSKDIYRILPRIAFVEYLLSKANYKKFTSINRELYAGIISEVSHRALPR